MERTYQKTHTISHVIKIVTLIQTTSPDTNHVLITLHSVL